MLLRTTTEIAPGALVEAQDGDRIILGEVASARVLDDGIELAVEVRHSFKKSWEPHQSWKGRGPESVLDSLLALNSQLERLASVRRQPQSEIGRPAPARRLSL